MLKHVLIEGLLSRIQYIWSGPDIQLKQSENDNAAYSDQKLVQLEGCNM